MSASARHKGSTRDTNRTGIYRRKALAYCVDAFVRVSQHCKSNLHIRASFLAGRAHSDLSINTFSIFSETLLKCLLSFYPIPPISPNTPQVKTLPPSPPPFSGWLQRPMGARRGILCRHQARASRSTPACRGRTSDEVWRASPPSPATSPPPTPGHRAPTAA